MNLLFLKNHHYVVNNITFSRKMGDILDKSYFDFNIALNLVKVNIAKFDVDCESKIPFKFLGNSDVKDVCYLLDIKPKAILKSEDIQKFMKKHKLSEKSTIKDLKNILNKSKEPVKKSTKVVKNEKLHIQGNDTAK